MPNGVPVRRPVVRLATTGGFYELTAVIDSGSPISVVDARFGPTLGIETSASPAFELALRLGGASGSVPMYDVELELAPPAGVEGEPVRWRTLVAVRQDWRMPFEVLFGQLGWFDRFRTTIGSAATTVHFDVEEPRAGVG